MTKSRRFDREDGIFNLISPSASSVARGHAASVMAAIDGPHVYRELGAGTLSAT